MKIRHIGTGSYNELSLTGTNALWQPEQVSDVSTARASALLALGTFVCEDDTTFANQLLDRSAELEAMGLALTIFPSGTTDDSPTIQSGVVAAIEKGVQLKLSSGDWYINSADIVCPGGVQLGNTYKALSVLGSGSGETIVHLSAGRKGFWWHSAGQTLNALVSGSLKSMSIIGPGITSGCVGFQVGGAEVGRSNLHTNFSFDDLIIDNVTTCAIFDDTTIIKGTSCLFKRCKYGIEWGYNIDNVSFENFQVGNNNSILAGATVSGITSGQPTFTVSSAVAAELQVGYAISLFNSLGVPVFPKGTYVGGIVGTTITATDYAGNNVNATLASGTATSATFVVGRAFNFGARLLDTLAGTLYPQYGSPFVSPYWSVSSPATRGRNNANSHKYFGAVSSCEMVADIGGTSHFDLEFHVYDERVTEPYRLGDVGQTILPRNLKWRGCYPNSSSVQLSPWVNCLSTSGVDCEISIKECSTDNQAATYPYLQVATYDGNLKVEWESNNLAMAGTNPNVVLWSAGNYGAKYQLAAYKTLYAGNARHGDAVVPVTLGGAYAWNFCGQDGLALTLSGNATINNPAAGGTTCPGKSFTVKATLSGSYSITFDTQFKALNGANLGTISAGTTGQKLVADFYWDGAYFWCRNTPTWV